MNSQSALTKQLVPYASPMSDENREFCRQIREFCEAHDISVRKLSTMCDGGRTRFSAATAHRLLHGTTDDAVVERIRPVLAPAFVAFLEDRGYFPGEIEIELSHIFDPKEFTKMIANRCPLSPQAARFHGLDKDPFDVDYLPQPNEIFTNPDIDSVVGRVKDAVLYQRFIAVVGGVGTGKTLLKLRVANELTGIDKKAKLLYPEFFDMEEVTVHGIANRILAELGQKIPQNKEARVSRIREVLTEMQQEGIGVAIVLDEAHRLRDKVISSLKNFWEMTNGRNSRLLGVILFGQPQFVDARLRDIKFKEIRQRVQIIEMPPMTASARDYIAHRIGLAGGSIDALFEDKAVERIAINAASPLAIGNLVNEALTDAFEQEEHRVTVSLPFFKKLSTGQQVVGMRRSAA